MAAQQSPTSQAVVPNTGVTKQVIETTNNFVNNNEVKAVFTADNVNAAAYTDVYIFPGRGAASKKTLPAGISFSTDANSFEDYASFIDWFGTVKQYAKYIRIQTNDTGNFSQKLTLGTRKPNQQNPAETDIQLVNYRTSTGAGFSDTLSIEDQPFTITPALYLIFRQLKKNTSVSIFIGISGIEDTATISPF